MTTLKCPRPSLLFSYYIILITSVLYLLLLYFIQHDSAPGYWEVWRSLCSNTTSPCNMGNPISGNSLSNYSYLYNINISFQHPEIPYFIIISEKEQEVAAAAVIVLTVVRCVPIESPSRRRVPCLFYFWDGKLVQKKLNLLVNMHPQGIIVVPGSSSFANAIKASFLLLLITASLQVNV